MLLNIPLSLTEMEGCLIRMGRIFDSYYKFRIFERFLAIRFDSKIRSYMSEYCSNIFLHVLHLKISPWRSFIFWLNYEKTTTNLLLRYLICIHTLSYKIKSLTLLKGINFTKQTCVKLTGNAVPASRLDTVQYSNRIRSHWIFLFDLYSKFRRYSIRMKLQIHPIRST